MSASQFNAAFEALRMRYAASFVRKRQALMQAWNAFAAAADMDTRCELELQLHRLSGSAGGYGFGRLGDHARAADVMLRDQSALPPVASAALSRAVHAVLEELATCAAETDANGGRLRIVLVEDDPAQAQLGAAQLEAQGCEVRVAADADTLWPTLLEWPCHAIVLDYWLHGETAMDISPRLRREPAFAAMALICYSAERDAAIVDGILAAGCDAMVDKAEGVERLLAQVRKQVARADRSGTDFA